MEAFMNSHLEFRSKELFTRSKGGSKSEDTGKILRLQHKIPTHYPEQKI